MRSGVDRWVGREGSSFEQFIQCFPGLPENNLLSERGLSRSRLVLSD